MKPLKHEYKFDPSYSYSLEQLLLVSTPADPPGYDAFWAKRYAATIEVAPEATISEEKEQNGWREFKLSYQSTKGVRINGWALLPHGEIEKVIVSMHGYGGIDGPHYDFRPKNTAILFPCARGISLSKHDVISPNPMWHVLHDIQNRDNYVHGGCVEDIWVAVTVAQQLFPQAADRIGFMGISFGGGIGAIALGFDERIARAHLNVPSFGNQPLRMSLPTTGSGAAVQSMLKRKPDFLNSTLAYYDAAIAAKRILMPMHCACAMFDPMVAPPGQFAIFNAIPSEKILFVLRAGHHEYPEQHLETQQLSQELNEFFARL